MANDDEAPATKADLNAMGAGLRGEMTAMGSALRGEMAAMRSELKNDVAAAMLETRELGLRLGGEMAGLRGEMADLRGEMRAEMSGLRREVRSELREFRGSFDAAFQRMEGAWRDLALLPAVAGDHERRLRALEGRPTP